MKSIMITFDQAYNERIVELLDRLNCRGFTRWEQVQGRGTKKGEPHYKLHEMDQETEMLGLRAFVWNVEQSI